MRRAREGQSANPPREDVEALWQAVLDRKIDWIVSDHACCRRSRNGQKTSKQYLAGEIRVRRHRISSFRRFERGSKRGMSYNHMAELLSWKPAQRFGLPSKGDIAPGYDADIAIVDPHESFVVRSAESESV